MKNTAERILESVPKQKEVVEKATSNMAYADFYPQLLTEHQCVKYAIAVANDEDGYEGIQFCKWIADVMAKKENIDWEKFK